MALVFLPIMFLGLPLIEIAGFVLVGRAIGLLPTLALVILTSVLGVILLRIEGVSVLRDASRQAQDGRSPGRTLVSGAMVVIAGILLILPGFFTDMVGLLLFIPPIRHFIWSRLASRVVMRRQSTTRASHSAASGEGDQQRKQETVLDLDECDFSRDPDARSPWSGPSRSKD